MKNLCTFDEHLAIVRKLALNIDGLSAILCLCTFAVRKVVCSVLSRHSFAVSETKTAALQ